MKESRKYILKLLYDYDQSKGGRMGLASDGKDTGLSALTLRDDICYLASHDYIIEHEAPMSAYLLSLTPKGEQFVENIFQFSVESTGINFNFGNAQITNAIIGNNASGNTFTSNGASFPELRTLIEAKPSIDQPDFQELLNILEELKESKEPVPRNLFSRFSNLICKHSDLIGPLGTTLVELFFGIS